MVENENYTIVTSSGELLNKAVRVGFFLNWEKGASSFIIKGRENSELARKKVTTLKNDNK